MRVEALERSSKSAQGSGSSSQTLDAYTALMEYELRRVSDGAPFALGTTKGGESDSGREAILEAISWVRNKVVADLGKSGNNQLGESGETGSEEYAGLGKNRDVALG